MSQEKIKAIESNVANMKSRLSRGNRITAFVGTIALVLVVGYFVYGYKEINSVLKPKTIVDLSQTIIDDNIPVIKKTVQSEVERNAPVWAESLSNQAIESVPQIRQALVDHTVEQTDDLVAQVVELGDDRFDAFVKDNRVSILQAISELKTNDEVSVELLDAIQSGFNEALQADMERDSQEILAYSVMMQEKMDRLFSGKKLTEAERLERQALSVLRRLQLTELKE